jgi:CBS domain-containing protein
LNEEDEAMKVNEAASRQAWTCQPQTDLMSVGRMMREGDFGIAPVVDEKGRVVGVITDRDICLAVAARQGNLRDVRVRDVATNRVYACRPEDDLGTSLLLMRDAQVRRLPVTELNRQEIQDRTLGKKRKNQG